MIFFENKLLLQSDVVFDSESNGRSLSSLAPTGGEKKIIFNFVFQNQLLLQPDEVFDSESNGRNFSSLAPPGGEKKLIFNYFLQNDVTSRRGRFYQIFLTQMKA